MFDKEPTAGLQNTPIWLQLRPDFEGTIALDKAEGRIEFEVGLEVLGESQLDFHSVSASVVQDNLLSVELFIDKNVQVVLFFLNVDRHINAVTSNSDRNRLSVVLILEEESEFL